MDHARQYHGGIPGKQHFDAADGKTYRVGRFLTLVDEEAPVRFADFSVPVASDFGSFLRLLRAEP